MNDNRMNKGEDIRKKISNQSAGSSDDKAADILNNAAFKNADLIKKPSSNTTNTTNTTDTGNSSELPKDGLEDNASKSSLGSLKDKAGEAAAVGGALASGNYGKAFFEFFKRHKKLCISVIGGGLIFLLMILAIPIIVASIGGTVIEFFSGIGDAIVGFFSPDEQDRMNEYYAELKEVKEELYKKKGICIDTNLITATLTVDVDAQNYANEIGSEPGEDVINGEESPYDDVPEIPEKDWDKMKKEVGILASMQIKTTLYAYNDEIVRAIDPLPCRSSEEGPLDEVVSEENLSLLNTPGWWHDYIRFWQGMLPGDVVAEKYISTNADLVSRHDLNAFQKFFTKKINEEKNYEYRIYTPAYEEEDIYGQDGSVIDHKKVCDRNYLPNDGEEIYSLSIGDLNTMEDAVYYWNLVNSFIPNYYEEFLPSEEGEQRDNAIKKIAEDIYLLYKDLGPDIKCGENVTTCSYAFNDDGSKITDLSLGKAMSNIKVELTTCGSNVSTGTILDLEDYLKGVTAAEIKAGKVGGINYESVKAQAIMASTYVLGHYDSKSTSGNGSTILKIQNCDMKQVYKSPDIILKENNQSVYDNWLSALREVEGMTLVDSSGNLIGNKEGEEYLYTSKEQNEWGASSSDYRSMLMATYANADNLYANCTTYSIFGNSTHSGTVSGASNCPAFFNENSDYWGWTGRYNGFINYGIQCTWYAYGRALQILHEDFGMELGAATSELSKAVGGDAGQWWDKNASTHVYDASANVDDARPGAIIVWGNNDPSNPYGHVAVVESVEKNPDGTIKDVVISQGNVRTASGGKMPCNIAHKTREDMLTQNAGNKTRYFKGYIYLGG